MAALLCAVIDVWWTGGGLRLEKINNTKGFVEYGETSVCSSGG